MCLYTPNRFATSAWVAPLTISQKSEWTPPCLPTRVQSWDFTLVFTKHDDWTKLTQNQLQKGGSDNLWKISLWKTSGLQFDYFCVMWSFFFPWVYIQAKDSQSLTGQLNQIKADTSGMERSGMNVGKNRIFKRSPTIMTSFQFCFRS